MPKKLRAPFRRRETTFQTNFGTIRLRRIPDVIRPAAERVRAEGGERSAVLSALHEDERRDRNLMAQSFRLLKRSFPRYARGPLTFFKRDFAQNTLPAGSPEKRTNYHFIAAATKRGNVAGFVATSIAAKAKTPVALVDYIAVHPSYQRGGLAKALLEANRQISRNEGVHYGVGEVEPYTEKDHAAFLQLRTKKRLTEEEKTQMKELGEKRGRFIVYRDFWKLVKGFDYLQPPLLGGKPVPMALFIYSPKGELPERMPGRELYGIVKSVYRYNYGLQPNQARELMEAVKERNKGKYSFELANAGAAVGAASSRGARR